MRGADAAGNGLWNGTMKRFVCVYLPEWAVERYRKDQGSPRQAARDTRPFALVKAGMGGLRLAAVDANARALGLSPGELLADARARVPELRAGPAEPHKDRAALVRLAHWSMRYSPYASPWRGHDGDSLFGLTLDITGCGHLFGGEEALARSIVARLKAFGFTARVAVADTIGAAHGLACFGEQPLAVIETGGHRAAIAPLPIAALRIGPHIAQPLRHFGLERIDDISHLPRASLTKRFGRELIDRLEQAMGDAAESFSPLALKTPYRATVTLAEPIVAESDVLALIHRMTKDLQPLLERQGLGARALRLYLFRVDGEIKDIAIRLAAPSRDPEHIEELFSLRLEKLADEIDAGFGFDAARLDVTETQAIAAAQTGLAPDTAQERNERLDHLIDRLGSRLGLENVLRAHRDNTHIPERAVVFRPAMHRAQPWDDDIEPSARPLLMLPAAEPADVIASVPEGPPLSFRWRNVRYRIAHAEGPERIRPEWWRANAGADERDYYILEDEEGRRFWLYRLGAYAPDHPPRWYVHGVFA
jgi:protein ImuB